MCQKRTLLVIFCFAFAITMLTQRCIFIELISLLLLFQGYLAANCQVFWAEQTGSLSGIALSFWPPSLRVFYALCLLPCVDVGCFA
jgi:hypothetical protein